jgi:ABC-type antimicrobial peptide transport system permease subunit
MEVVGVVGDVHDGPLGSEPRPHVYVPLEQMHDSEFDQGVAVGGSGARSFFVALVGPDDPTRLAGAAVEALRDIDPSLPVTDVQTMAQVVARGVASRRFSMAIVSAFGVVALLLAAIGLYGVLAYRVAARRREIGVRVALGADRAQVVRSVLGDGLLLVLGGAGLGLLGAAGLARFLQSVLYETSARDPWAFAAAPLVLVVAALAASYLPALRASRVDPMRALRVE